MTDKKHVKIDEKALPENWIVATLVDITEYIQRGKSPKYIDHSDLPVINQKCIRWFGIEKEHLKYVHPDQWEKWAPQRYVQEGDILWNSTGTGTIGRAAVIKHLAPGEKYVVDSHVTIVRPKEVEPLYVHYWIMSHSVQGSIEAMQSGSTNQVELSKAAVEALPIPVAPLGQQKRIVAEIEKQFSRLDEAVANLKRVKANLKRYKAAVLKAAVEGKLTEEWRNQHPDVEPASKLLERILTERRQKWEEAELAKMKAKGKTPKDDKWKKKYKEPDEPDTNGLSKLPEGWVWTQIETVTDMMSGHAFKKAEYSKKGVRLFQIANVSFGYTKWDKIEHLPESYIEQWENLLLKEGDVLMALNRPLLSRELKIAKLGPNDVPAILYQRVGKFLFYFEDVADYFLIFMQSPYYINALESQLQGVNIPFINKGKLLSTPLPLPASIFEMDVIVDKVKVVLSIIKTTEIEIENNFKRSNGLRQTILQKAFCGQLVQAEPGDEPAGNILKRLKIQRDTKSAEPKLKKRGRMVAKKKTVKFERRKILDVLRESDKELSTAKLVELTGYPSDADPDTIEPFYLDLKKTLDSEEIEYFRKGDFDYFRIKSTA